MRSRTLIALLAALLFLPAYGPLAEEGAEETAAAPAPTPWPDEELAGGETTVFDRGPSAYGRALRNLERRRWLTMRAGKRLFENAWIAPDPSPHADVNSNPRRGLGPRFNADSCASCHFRDGRGAPPTEIMAPPEPPPYVARLRRSSGEPDPRYGKQLNDFGVGLPPEGRLEVETVRTSWRSPDGQVHALTRPRAVLADLSLGPLAADTQVDLRVPPTLVGLGLLEAVPVEAIEALADPDDRDGDGISGRLRYLPGPDGPLVGRFGWKAGQATLEAQVAHAFIEDLGVTSSLFPDANCPSENSEHDCRRLAGTDIELSNAQLDRVTLYTRLLAPPARRDVDQPDVLLGREVFMQVGCADCHTPSLRTAELAKGATGRHDLLPEIAGQTIRPFTDLLLHDMGPGLADGAPAAPGSARNGAREGVGDGPAPSEWRTAPLWGLGLMARINGHLRLLHDGRAQTIEEAILWHGGESARSRERFVELSPDQQAALLRFLESL